MSVVIDDGHIIEILLALVTAIGSGNLWFFRIIAKEIKLLRQHVIKSDHRLEVVELRINNCKKCPSLKTATIPSLEEEGMTALPSLE